MSTTFDIDLSVATLSKHASTFYPPEMVDRIRTNVEHDLWASEMRNRIITAAEPWLTMTDEEAWALVVGPTLIRSWTVWDSGYCPDCHADVHMYAWVIDALRDPWKVRCPQCGALFPKNDFTAYYRSGLDAHGVFHHYLADRALLFNNEHPDPRDPLHRFGVDDGDGMTADGHRWRFIATYLIYGQWKQQVVGGVQRLASAYLVTGNARYAHKAGVLLDRVADLYPDFDFGTQAWVHGGWADGSGGYVSIWHDACCETRVMAMAYDAVFPALREDAVLVTFLTRQARRYALPEKATFADIQRNIEDRIFQDALAHRSKIMCNYPHTDITVLLMIAVLGWPGNRDAVYGLLDWILQHATGVDGTTGEKGMTDYSSFTVAGLGLLMAELARLDPDVLPWAFARHPNLYQTFRFHIDARCLDGYFPMIGDAGSFALKPSHEIGVNFIRTQGLPELVDRTLGNWAIYTLALTPSMFTFLWQLYRFTGEAIYLQHLVRAAGGLDDLPFDITAEDPAAIRREIAEVIAREGAQPRVGSVNKQQWRLAILRSGEGEHARAAWLHYATGGHWHGHPDGMNLGLFALGLDLMPDFGYPPLSFPGAYHGWYRTIAAHNTVVVDGRQSVRFGPAIGGETTLWVDQESFHVIRVSAPAMVAEENGTQYERTAALVDIAPDACYLLDIFRVVGGRDHAKFMHSHFATLTTTGLSLQPIEPYGHETMMRDFRGDSAPAPGWSADFAIDDRYGYLPSGATPHLRYTDLTSDAAAAVCEGWVAAGGFSDADATWIPRLMIRRTGDTPLASTFVAVIEPFAHDSAIAGIRRLPLQTVGGKPCSDAHVAVEVTFTNGCRDVIIQADAENASGIVLVQPEHDLRLDGEMCLVRWDAAGTVQRVYLCHGKALYIRGKRVTE